ncbi:MAG TPA: NERD domain-containing protein [Bacillota bacterium]|nr:NERD domain-containing protein [Bacillota bacterium]
MSDLAQLIKLYDHVSRYEWNMYRYPSQYIRLKNENWKSLYNDWVNGYLNVPFETKELEEKPSNFMKIKNFFTGSQMAPLPRDEHTPYIETELQLRQYFLNELYPFQIKWATSTLSEISVLDESVEHDETLKYFLHRFPDIYLLMYYPVFDIRNTPIDGEILMISPTHIEIITLMEYDENISILVGDDRRWTLEQDGQSEQIISPLITLKRTESIVKSILNKQDINFSVERTIISRKNPILYHVEPFHTNIIGRERYNEWFEKKRRMTSPLKREQLNAAEALIQHCMSTSVKRPEWERDDDIFPVGE